MQASAGEPEMKCKGSGEMSKDLPIAEDGTAICPVCYRRQRAERVGEETLIHEHFLVPAETPASRPISYLPNQ
jgi:hypothetical protein